MSGRDRADPGEREAPSAPPQPVRLAARLGLVARALFYLLLAGLALQLALGTGAAGRSTQANANGAFSQVARAPLGLVLLAGAAAGFAAFAGVRLYGAIRDRRHGGWRRLSTAGQGLIYLGMASVTLSFVLGRRAAGSEEQQRSTVARVIGLPFGRLLLVAAGLVVLAMCVWQLLVAARGDFAESLREHAMHPLVHRLTLLTARVGIPARGLAIAPVGVFLVVAGVRSDPREAKGLDALLIESCGTVTGRTLVVLAAAGFAVFAVYSLLEARYRQVASGA
ncbi:MAG TPA: DUF1206 domain-containing protein [Kineosporiaceae bacterium]|nr:DUF1206 domain-containing protein [Kineosporiaceae bacterium]